MTNIVSEFDPATETDPDIHSMQHGEYGIYFTNESIYGIKLTFGQGVATRIVPPFQAKPLHICITGDTFQWEIRYALPTGGQAPPRRSAWLRFSNKVSWPICRWSPPI